MVAWELGDLLFAAANLARHLDKCAEDLLREANRRFRDRFVQVEKLARARGIQMKDSDLATLEGLWQEAKKILGDA
jgi:ATP diphosphatase